jgi:hypothetical protein
MKGSEITNRFEQLVSVRKTLDTVFQEVEAFCSPYRGEFFKDLSTETEVDWHRGGIYDSTACHASELLAAHIHGALTPPGIKWFGFEFRDDALNEVSGAKEWLEECTNIVDKTLKTESDFNTEIAEVYTDLVTFGTSIIMQEPVDDLEWKGYDFTAWPIMDCYFEMGADSKPSRVYRKIRYTKLQLQERFPDLDAEKYSEDGDVDRKFEVIFCVYWRDRDIKTDTPLQPKDRPVGYKYVMKNDSEELEEGGYYEFPAMAPRWRKTAGAVWGNSPSMKMIADIRMLNETVAQTTEGIAKGIDPPMISSDRGVIDDLDVSPGGLTMVTEVDQLVTLEPKSRMDWAVMEKERIQEQVWNGYYLNVLTLKESPAMTATEVIDRRQEMMRFMGPTAGRMQNDLLDPLVQNTFMGLLRMGQLPEIPEGLQGADLDVVYVGPLPRAAKLEEAASIQTWMGEVMIFAEANPSVLDNVDWDAMVRGLADARGVPTKFLATAEEMAESRKARAEMEQAQAQLEMMKTGSEVVKNTQGAELEAVG